MNEADPVLEPSWTPSRHNRSRPNPWANGRPSLPAGSVVAEGVGEDRTWTLGLEAMQAVAEVLRCGNPADCRWLLSQLLRHSHHTSGRVKRENESSDLPTFPELTGRATDEEDMRDEHLGIRLKGVEKVALRLASEERGETVSDYVRRVALREARRDVVAATSDNERGD